jgi:polyribonucleotide nucleotidyltransferase
MLRLNPFKADPKLSRSGPTVFLHDENEKRLARDVLADVRESADDDLPEFITHTVALRIDPDKVGVLVGKGGETIRELQEEFGARVEVDEKGAVIAEAPSGELAEQLASRIRAITKNVEVGDSFTGKVVKTTTFGAFVELAKGTDGLLHISNIAPGKPPARVEEVVHKGDEIKVRVVEVDRERGRIGLRLADDPGAEVAPAGPREAPRRPRGRPRRSGNQN